MKVEAVEAVDTLDKGRPIAQSSDDNDKRGVDSRLQGRDDALLPGRVCGGDV